MDNIQQIFDMLDWHKAPEIQSRGRCLAKESGMVAPFIQPNTSNYNKNVWDNCAIIINDIDDEKIKPFLVELLFWLQDMNWPGALCIYQRLLRYIDKESLGLALDICIENAKSSNDTIWEQNLEAFIQTRLGGVSSK